MDLNDGDPVMKMTALDLGKSKRGGCLYDTVAATHRFESAPLDRAALETALEAERPDRVMIEGGTSVGRAGDPVRDREVDLQVAHPSHQARRRRRVKKKTDRLDALKPAELGATRQWPTVSRSRRDVRPRRSLMRHRLIARRTALKNRIRSIFEGEGLSRAKGCEAFRPQGSRVPSRTCRHG